jgi:hypothetical protein
MRKTLVLLLAVVSTFGCTTMRVVAPADLQASLGKLQPQDRIAVRTANAWQADLTVAGVSDASIEVETRSGEHVTFAKVEIAELQVRTRAPGKAAALAAGIYILGVISLCGVSSKGGC